MTFLPRVLKVILFTWQTFPFFFLGAFIQVIEIP